MAGESTGGGMAAGSPASAVDGGGTPMSARMAGVAWLVLAGLTIFATVLARGAGTPPATSGLIAVVIGLAGVKFMLILGVYMGTWRAPRWCALGAWGWTVVTCLLIGAFACRWSV